MREIIDCHKTEKNNKRLGEKREEGPGPGIEGEKRTERRRRKKEIGVRVRR